MIAQLWHRLQLMIAQGVGQLTTDDKVQITIQKGETPPNIKRIEPYGTSSRPPGAGFQSYIVFPSGDRSSGLCLIIGDIRYQVELLPGEVALHDDQGQKVHLTRHGIVIDGGGKPITMTNTSKVRMESDLEVTGDIKDQCDGLGETMNGMRSIYNGHTHADPQGGSVGTPSEGM